MNVENNLPISSQPLKAALKPQEPGSKTWEFCVGDGSGKKECAIFISNGVNKIELNKLPNYPITRAIPPKKRDRGIEVMLQTRGSHCIASFHGYDEKSRYGKSIYIGSRGSCKRSYTQLYWNFLKSFGVNVTTNTALVPVEMNFCKGNIVKVWRRRINILSCRLSQP